VNEVPLSQLRISDSERESALTALGEHMSVGRLDLDEYGERSAKVTAVKTRGELIEVFADLPEPHPRFEGRPPPAEPALAAPADPEPRATAEPAPAQRSSPPEKSPGQRVAGALSALSVIAALALFFTTGAWQWFLLIPAISIIGGSLAGSGHHATQRAAREERNRLHRERHEAHRERQRERRELHRERRDEWRDRRRDHWH
jgi:hypothetical protein